MKKYRILIIIITFACILIASGSFYLYKVFNRKIVIKNSFIVMIPKGASVNKIRQILNQNGIIISNFEIKTTVKWYNIAKKLKYGKFSFENHSTFTLKSFLEEFTKNGTLTKNVTFPEGIRLSKMAQIVKNKLNIDSIAFMIETKNEKLLNKYNIKATNMEGYLYPETYNFNESSTAFEIVDKMASVFFDSIKTLEQPIKNSKYDLHQILTLASIIQGEVMVEKEISFISAVYNNRLNKRMLLQADPTIQYLLKKPKRLYFKDLEIDSKYNTYKYKGLPPGPINNPSLSSIKAALYPAKKKYIFMVAKGNGEHYFNNTLSEHLRDKNKFDKVRKKVKRK